MQNSQVRRKILFAVLNWGLGHATRSSVLIRELVNRGYEVHLASDGEAGQVLRRDFPDLPYHTLESYGIRYGSKRFFNLTLLLKGPRIMARHRKEQRIIRELHRQYQFIGVISDNRPSAGIRGIPSVYITHQLTVKSGYRTPLVSALHRWFYTRFTEIWVPDTVSHFLSGELSDSFTSRVRYIGWLSRFPKVPQNRSVPWAAVLSGPEPSRSEWEKDLIKLRHTLPEGGIIVRGKPGEGESSDQGILNYLDRDGMAQLYADAEVIISRSGYSTLMDLALHGKKAILVPTPGQPEQEYLARHLAENRLGWIIGSQGNIDYASVLNDLRRKNVRLSEQHSSLPEDLFALFESEGES